MANIPQNTQYGSPATPAAGINFSSLLKNLQQKTQTPTEPVKTAPIGVPQKLVTPPPTPAPEAGTPPIANIPSTFSTTPPAPGDTSLMPHDSAFAFENIFGKAATPNPTVDAAGVPINTPIGAQAGTGAYEALPAGYKQFMAPDANGNWVTPSDQAKLRDWPTTMGGGQWIVDPTQPDKMVKSSRAIMDAKINPGAKQKVLGNLSPSLYQVDHIVPLWVGGADTLGNLQVYDNVTHAKKTDIQAVPLTLLAHGKINLNEARLMALTWKDKDATGLPSDDAITAAGGYVPLDVAEKMAQKWKDDVGKVDVMKYFGESFKENIANFGKGWLPDPIREFGKGLVGGGTAGIVPGTQASPESGTVGAVSNVAGNVLGSITGIGLLGKGLGAIKGLTMGAQEAEGISNAINITDNAMKSANLATDIGSLTPTAVASANRMNTLNKMASSAGLMSLWGQIGLTGREATGQQDPTFQNHVTQFLTDVAFGSLLGSAKQSVRGYATVGLGSTAFSLMQGNEIVPALQDGALMTALHGLGYQKGILDPAKVTGNEEAYKMAATTLNQYVGDAIPTVKKGESIPTVLTLDLPKVEQMRNEFQTKYPYDQRFTNTTPITTQAQAIDFMGKAAKRNFGNLIAKSDGTIPQEDLKKEMTRITVAQNQLLNQTLPPELRAQKEMQDLYSMGEKLRPQVKSGQLRASTNTSDLLKNVPFNTPTDLMPNPDGLTFPTGNVPTTGYGDNIDVTSKQTINDFYNNPNNFSNKLYIVKDPETASIMRLVQQEQIASGQKPTTGNPEDALRVFVKDSSGQIRPVGYIPREESFTKKNGLNKTYHEITNRIRGTIDRAKTPTELQAFLAKDKAQITATPEEITQLFNNKLAVKSMSDEDLYALLKPTNAMEKYNSALNNSTLSQAMDQKGLNVLMVDTSKVMPTGGAFPRANPENPYLALNVNEQDWLRSLELKKGSPQHNTEMNQSISDIVSKQQSENMAKSTRNILEKVKNPETPVVPVAPTPVEPNSPNKFSPEEIKSLRKQGFSEDLIRVMESRNTSTNPFLETRMPPHVSETAKTTEVPPAPTETPTVPESLKNVAETVQQKSIPKPRTFVQMNDGSEGVNAGMAAYTSDPTILKNYTREKLTDRAKTMSDDGQNIPDGWTKYLSAWEDDIKKATGHPDFKITNKKELNDLEWSYKHLVDAGRRSEFVMDSSASKPSIKEGSLGNIGQVDRQIKEYNAANGLPADAMSVLNINKNRSYSKEFMSDSREKFDENKEALSNINGSKYLPVGITAKGAENVVYLKYEPKLVAKYDADPAKYTNEGESITTPEDKFLRVFSVDVLNLPKDMSSADYVKRANLIYHRYDRYSEPDANSKVKIHILNAKKISDYPELSVNKDQLANPESAAAKNTVDTFSNGSTIDGKIIIGEKLYDKLVSAFNYDPRKFETGLKPLISGDVDVNGKLTKLIQKGHAIKADPALRDMLQKDHGLNLGANDIASFDTNTKVGPKQGTYDISLNSIFAKPLGLGEEGRLKISKERQFTGSDKGVTEDMLKQTNERRADFEAINSEIKNSKNKEDLENIINKYADRYNINKDDLFFGARGESFNLGAAKINLSHNIEKVLKNIYSSTVISDALPNSARVFISPSLKLPLDGPNKPPRFLNNDEVILGKEFMAKRSLKAGDEVLISRDPSYDINNLVVAKVIDGSKFGHTSLGNEHGAVSLYNERLKLGGDQDADTMLVTKVGEGGVPKSYADAVKARGSKAIPFTEVNPNKKSYITAKNIENTIKDQLVGDDQTTKISVVNRIMDSVMTNKLTFEVSPATTDSTGKKFSQYRILSDGKVVETGQTTPNKDGFTATPKWGDKEKQLRTQALQEAVDSKKSNDIVKRTENNNPNWMLKQVFADEDGVKLDDAKARSLNGALKNYQKGFNPEKISDSAKNVDDIQKQLKPFHDMAAKIKENGGTLTPWQEKILSLSDIKSFSTPQETLVKADQLGANAVKEQIKDVDLSNPALDQIRKIANQVKALNFNKDIPFSEKRESIKKLNDYFTSNVDKGKYSQKDLDAIAFWAATTKEANLKHGETYKTPKYIYRFNTMINKSPRVAKAYYEGSESVPETETKKDGQGGPYDGQGGPTMGKIEIIARHGSTDSNGEKVFRGWEESKINQLTDKGKNDAKKLGESLKKEIKDPENYIIISSDLQRAADTAKIVSKITGIKTGQAYPQLRSQDTGDYTGMKESLVKHKIDEMINKTPNKPLPGASESYNDFITRLKKTLKPGGLIELHNPGKKIIVIAHHQVDVVQANDFDKATDAMFAKGLEPGGHRYLKNKKYDGKGGLISDMWGGLKQNVFQPVANAVTGAASAINNNVIKPIADTAVNVKQAIMDPLPTYNNTYNAVKKVIDPVSVVKPQTYNIRGINVSDSDLDEAKKIAASEVSNRPDKIGFETQNMVNTAINRALANPNKYQGSLTKVLQEPAQYQGYAPTGMNVKGGKVIQSQYQKIASGNIDAPTQAKLKTISDALDALKSGKAKDITAGKQFYVHASDGSMWLGKDQAEAKKLANLHEKQIKSPITKWGTLAGLAATGKQKITPTTTNKVAPRAIPKTKKIAVKKPKK